MNESIFLVLLICGHRTGAENKILAFGYRFWYIFTPHAGIAQLVERNLAKVDVAGSSPVSRSAPNLRGMLALSSWVQATGDSNPWWSRLFSLPL